MKIRFLSLFLMIVFLFCSVPRCQAQTTLGDVNGDGKINAADALLILKHSVGKIKLKEEAKQAADTTGSHDLSAKDALCILQKAVGSIRHFPAEITPVSFTNWGEPHNENYICSDDFSEQPIIGICKTQEEMINILSEKMGVSDFACDEIADKYPDKYFEKQDLIILKVTTPSYGTQLQIKRLYEVQHKLFIELTEWETPGALTPQNRIYWVELSKKGNRFTDAQFINNRLNYFGHVDQSFEYSLTVF